MHKSNKKKTLLILIVLFLVQYTVRSKPIFDGPDQLEKGNRIDPNQQKLTNTQKNKKMTKKIVLKGKLQYKKYELDGEMSYFIEGNPLPLRKILKEFYGEYVNFEYYVFESQQTLEKMQIANCIDSMSVKGRFGNKNDSDLPDITKYISWQNRTSESREIVSQGISELVMPWGMNLKIYQTDKIHNKFIYLKITVLDSKPIYD